MSLLFLLRYVAPSVSITTPVASATITTNPYLVTAAVEGAPHHLQFEISSDGGTTWERLSAWNPAPPYETNFNTWRFPNGSYKLRAKIYSGADESTLLATSAVVDFTISLAAGTVRDYVGGVDTIAAAITAASDGDTIRLDGTFPSEGTRSVNKKVKIIQKPGGARAVIQSRCRLFDGVYCSEVDFTGAGAQTGPEPEGKAAVIRGTPSNPINITNGNAGIALQEGSTIPFDPDGAFDTLVENANIHDCGNRTTETNAAHGIYGQNSTRLFVRETILYHNAARQIQLYPQSIQATIYKCALYDSEQGVNLGGDTSTGAGMGDANGGRQFVSSYCKIEKCIIGKGGGDDGASTDALVYTFWGNSTPPGAGNEIVNCFLHDPPTSGAGSGKYIDTTHGGLTDAGGNVTGLSPGYTNAPSANFILTAGANATGYGPDRIQPVSAVTVTPGAATALGLSPSPVVQTLVSQTAGLALSSSPAPVIKNTVVAAAALGLGSSPAPVVSDTVPLTASSSNGSSSAPVVKDTVVPTAALAQGSAPAPVSTLSAFVTAAFGLGSSPAPVPLVVVPLSAATALGVTPTATAVIGASNVTVTPSAALSLGITPAPVVLVAVPPIAASAAGSAPVPTDLVVVPISAALAAGAVPSAMVQVAKDVAASLALGASPPPALLVAVPMTAALAAGSAPAPVVAVTLAVIAANATGATINPVGLVKVLISAAVAQGSTPSPTIISGSGAIVTPSAALALASALGASVQVSRVVAAATANGSPPQPALSVQSLVTAALAQAGTPAPTAIAATALAVAASVLMAELQQQVVSATDLVTVSVGVTDTSSMTVAVTDAGSSSVSAQDAGGTSVTVSDLVP